MPLFGQILAALYQEDIVDEDDIRAWHALPVSKGEDRKPGPDTENFKKCWLIGSHMIKQFDDQDTDEDSEESESEETPGAKAPQSRGPAEESEEEEECEDDVKSKSSGAAHQQTPSGSGEESEGEVAVSTSPQQGSITLGGEDSEDDTESPPPESAESGRK